jgi:hypothetical protein
VVVMAIGCGSGGGAPVGRRCRRVPWTGALPGGGPGRAAGPAAAGVRSALSVMAHAAFQATPLVGRRDLFLSCTADAAACSHHAPLQPVRPCCAVANQARMIASTAGRLPRNSLGLRFCAFPGQGIPQDPLIVTPSGRAPHQARQRHPTPAGSRFRRMRKPADHEGMSTGQGRERTCPLGWVSSSCRAASSSAASAS